MVSRAHESLIWYAARFSQTKVAQFLDRSGEKKPVITVRHYNSVLRGWANEGEWSKVEELFDLMKSNNIDPNEESYSYLLFSLLNQGNSSEELQRHLKEIKYDLKSVIKKCKLNPPQKSALIIGLSKLDSHLQEHYDNLPREYECELLKEYGETKGVPYSPISGGPSLDRLKQLALEQLEHEERGVIRIESVTKKGMEYFNDPERTRYANEWNRLRDMWRERLLQSFREAIIAQQSLDKDPYKISLLPYLCLMEPEVYVSAALEEVEMSAISSPHSMPFGFVQVIFSSLDFLILL